MARKASACFVSPPRAPVTSESLGTALRSGGSCQENKRILVKIHPQGKQDPTSDQNSDLNRKLLDNFSHESDFTSLQDPFTSRPYKTPFYFYYWVPRKIPRGILFQIHVEYSPSSRLLVSDHCSLRHCVKDYDSLVLSPCSTTVFALDCFSHWTTTSVVRLFDRTGHSLL